MPNHGRCKNCCWYVNGACVFDSYGGKMNYTDQDSYCPNFANVNRNKKLHKHAEEQWEKMYHASRFTRIGGTFEYNSETYLVVPEVQGCLCCAFDRKNTNNIKECRECNQDCVGRYREDGKSVIFVKK